MCVCAVPIQDLKLYDMSLEEKVLQKLALGGQNDLELGQTNVNVWCIIVSKRVDNYILYLVGLDGAIFAKKGQIRVLGVEKVVCKFVAHSTLLRRSSEKKENKKEALGFDTLKNRRIIGTEESYLPFQLTLSWHVQRGECQFKGTSLSMLSTLVTSTTHFFLLIRPSISLFINSWLCQLTC